MYRMTQRYRCRVQSKARTGGWGVPVELVAHDRMAEEVKMSSNLMPPTRPGKQAKSSVPDSAPFDLPVRQGLLPSSCFGRDRSITVPPQGSRDSPSITLDHSFDDRYVLLSDGASLERFTEATLSNGIFGDDQDTTRLAV